MTAHVIDLAARRPASNPGNGAREALIDVCARADDPTELADAVLSDLWVRGFKVVPLDDGDAA